MKWSFAMFAALSVGCAHGRGAKAQPALPPASSAPPASSVTSTDVGHENPVSLEQMLAGRISGVIVTPARGGGIMVRIGGPTSFYAGQQPLIIVDDVPVDGTPNGTLTWLNPRDIESIVALKDPSQTAIYGVRGANGVIVIKTKGSH